MRYLVFIFLLFSCREKCDIRNIEHRYDSLETVNSNLKLLEKSYLAEIDSLSKIPVENKVKVVYLNNNKNEKIRVVGGYNNNELYIFFANTPTEDIN